MNNCFFHALFQAILERTGYSLDVTTGQRKYGGPPPGWDGPVPGSGHEVCLTLWKDGTFLAILLHVDCSKFVEWSLNNHGNSNDNQSGFI